MRAFLLACVLAAFAAGCSHSHRVAISADPPPSPNTWAAYPAFSRHSCWSQPTTSTSIMRFAPSAPVSPSSHPTPPKELARRVLARLGDESVVRGIEIGAPPPRSKLAHVFPGKRPPADALWAYISAPEAAQLPSSKLSPEEARSYILAEWETELVGGALRDDFCSAGGRPLVGWGISGSASSAVSDETFALNQRFPNPSPKEFRERVSKIGKRYGFRAASIRLLRPRELAPIVVVQTERDRKEFVGDVRTIMDLLDPKASTRHQTALTFEGFFFEARDAGGPFVRVYNTFRGEVAGGQWSWDPDTYPYPHG